MAKTRIATLDGLRGVAVMGILTMNIIGFGMIDAAYFNPRAQGGAQGLDLAVYLVNFVLFDGKMRGLFSFLFGASMLLIADRAEAKGESAAAVHYRRMIWLLLFGLAHLWLIWWGDILAHYALVGMVAFTMRRMRTMSMVVAGISMLLLQFVLMLGLPFAIHMATQGLSDPAQAAQARETLDGMARQFGVPGAAQIAADVRLYGSGDYAAILANRMDRALWVPMSSLMLLGLETLAYMLFGMAAFRSGLLTGEWSRARTMRWAAIGLGIGIPAYAAIAVYMADRQFDMFAVTMGVLALSTPVRPFMILGWACIILLLMRPGATLTTRIEAAGRMAFTNYLMTSLICTSLFYGYGAGLFGQLSRTEIYLVVIALWAGMLLWSKPWLDRFAYGPFEWLWRSLARGKRQRWRVATDASASQ